ncbi:Iridoid oxidase [Linum perenne]
MDSAIFGAALLLLLWVIWTITTDRRRRRRRSQHLGRLPPGPRPLPIVGNIFNLGWAPHESFVQLAQAHGPIMTLYLGSMCTVVISSKEAARTMFKCYDVVFAGRKIYESMKGLDSNDGSIITAQYGPHWRMLRRLSTAEFFASHRVDATRAVRRRCVDRMVQFVEEAGCGGTRPVDLGRFVFLMAFNLIGNLVLSKDLVDPKSERGALFFYHMGKVMEFAGKPNMADFFPLLRWLDPQRIRKKTQFHVEKAFEIARKFIQTSSVNQYSTKSKRKKDFLDVLLDFRGVGVDEPSSFSHRIVNVIIFEMFLAGTDTTTSTLEWAMAELLRNPEKLHKVQTELKAIVGLDKKLEEEDIQNLPYLKAVINETLRLHPPLPLLIPHMAMQPCKMHGYYIPKETQILVNVWGIGRDPSTWPDPLDFKPERFLDSDTLDHKGQHFEFLPFGSGRRMCPALPLASRVLPLALGSLLHEFTWAFPDGLEAQDMDMSEMMGITLRKAIPLKVIPIKRN